MGVEVLEDVKVSEIATLGVRFALGGACLKGLHLVVYEVGWGYLSSAGYELEGGVKGSASKGGDNNGADDGSAM